MVKKIKLESNFNQEVTKVTKLRNGQLNIATNKESYTFSAVSVAIETMAAPRSLGVTITSSEAKHLFTDIQKINPDQKCVKVVGGGDSAAEYANIHFQRCHQVTLSYREHNFNKAR